MFNYNHKQHLKQPWRTNYLSSRSRDTAPDDLHTEKEEAHSVIALLFMPFGLHSAAEHLCSSTHAEETPGAKWNTSKNKSQIENGSTTQLISALNWTSSVN